MALDCRALRNFQTLQLTHETAKNADIFHTHYNFFSQLQKFFQQLFLFIWATILRATFLENSLQFPEQCLNAFRIDQMKIFFELI